MSPGILPKKARGNGGFCYDRQQQSSRQRRLRFEMLEPRWLLHSGLLTSQFGPAFDGALGAQFTAWESRLPQAVQPLPAHVDGLLQRAAGGEEIRVIAELSSRLDQSALAEQAERDGATGIYQFEFFPLLALKVNDAALRGLLGSSQVVSIMEDIPHPPSLSNSLPAINGPQAHSLGLDGSGLAVAILDTGIDRTHPFFSGRVVEEACYSNGAGFGSGTSLCPNGSSSQTGTGAAGILSVHEGVSGIDHGQHVAGIAAGDGAGVSGAPPAGVAPGADIIAIQVFTRIDDSATCNGMGHNAPCALTYPVDQIRGLERVLELSSQYSIAAANLSLGGGQHTDHCDQESAAYKAAIDNLRGANVATVVAAGNDGFSDAIGFPACISTAVAVGSTTNEDAVWPFHNRGRLLDVFAPGVDILSSVLDDEFGTMTGTSMAAPHVAGSFALLREANPNLTVSQIVALLQDTGLPLTYQSGGSSVTTTRIDLLAAAESATAGGQLELFATGFESSEGYSLGFLGNQQGWTFTTASGTDQGQPRVSSTNPATGTRHMRIGTDAFLNVGTQIGGRSPALSPQDPGRYTVSVDVRIAHSESTGRSSYVVEPAALSQDNTFAARVVFAYDGSLRVFDDLGNGFDHINTGQNWVSGSYRNLTIQLDASANTIDYYYDNNHIHSSNTGVFAADAIEVAYLYGWNTNFVSLADFDNLTISTEIEAQELGEIRGFKWHDLNGNGVWDDGEPPLAGWEIYLDANNNGQWDEGELKTTTAADGSYAFTGLPPGEYTVAEVMQNGWEQTFPGPGGQGQQTGQAAGNPDYAERAEALAQQLTTTNSPVPIYTTGGGSSEGDGDPSLFPQTAESGPLINLDLFRADPRFAGIEGQNYAVVVLDTGINLTHPFFGDRIVYSWDFADDDADASDFNGHGSNVTSIVASQDATYPGVAPGVDIIHLKVFRDDGGGSFSYTEQALQWVVANVAAYNIVAVNMSLSDQANYGTAQSLYGLGDELAALAALDVITVSSSGNHFYTHDSVQGVGYPSADPNSLSVGAVYDANIGGVGYESGAIAHTTGPDRITPFSQRHSVLSDIFAPGAAITGAAGSGTGTVSMHGTSQASPHVAGAAVLAQQLAEQHLGRRLTLSEFQTLLQDTGAIINDGDDEDDNVVNTGLEFPRLDMLALGEAILAMGNTPFTHTVTVQPGQIVENVNFGNRQLAAATTTVVTSNANPAVYGDDVFFTATVSADSGTPTGSVQFLVNGTNLGTPVALSDGTAQSIVVANLNATTHTVTAQYQPDGDFAGSTGQLAGGQLITPRPITVSAAADTKVYDGTTASAETPTITSGNLATGDAATWTQTFDNKNVGTGKTLTPAGAVNDGNDGNNYDVTFVNDTSGEITQAELTVTGITAADKEYDGTTAATLDVSGAGLVGVFPDDTVALNTSNATGAFQDPDPGTNKTVTVSGLTIEGADAPNYSLTQPTTTASILADTTGIGLQVAAVAMPSDSGSDVLPSSLTTVPLGSTYYVEVWVQDRSEPGLGVAGGWVDVNYTTAVADAEEVFHLDFDVSGLEGGEIDDTDGVVRDLGGGMLQGGVGVAPEWGRLAYVEFLAKELGETVFELSPGSLEFALFDQGYISWDLVDLGTSVVVNQISGTRIDMRVVAQPSATGGGGEVDTLPDNESWVHEWQSFWVEIWVSTPDSTTLGVAEAAVDLQYQRDYLTAQEIEHGPAFTLDRTGTIDDTQGLVSSIGGRTELNNVGDDAYALLARIRFASTGDDQVPVDQLEGNIGPYDMQLTLANGQTRLVSAEEASEAGLGAAAETELWAVVYDIDDNNRIDFGDFSFFAGAFGKEAGPPSSQTPYTWWADFDKSGQIDFGDLAFFAPNFNKTRAAVQSGDQTLVFPPNFPDAWREQASGDGEGEAHGGGGEQVLSSAWPAAGVADPKRLSQAPLEHRAGWKPTARAVSSRNESAIADSAPWLTSGGRESPTDEALAGHTRRRSADHGRDDHLLDRRDPLEDILTLLAEQKVLLPSR